MKLYALPFVLSLLLLGCGGGGGGSTSSTDEPLNNNDEFVSHVIGEWKGVYDGFYRYGDCSWDLVVSLENQSYVNQANGKKGKISAVLIDGTSQRCLESGEMEIIWYSGAVGVEIEGVVVGLEVDGIKEYLISMEHWNERNFGKPSGSSNGEVFTPDLASNPEFMKIYSDNRFIVLRTNDGSPIMNLVK